MAEAVLALDIGTTAIKAALFAEGGALLALEREPTPVNSPQVGWLEHDPEALWAVTSDVLARLSAAAASSGVRPAAIAVTGARGTVCLVDASGVPLTPFLTWQDRRALSVLPRLRERLDGEDAFYRRTGVRLDPSIMAPKLAWLRQHSATAFEDARWAATTQGLAVQRLTRGEPTTDLSTASFFGLVEIAEHEWSRDLVERFELPVRMLPPIVRPGTVAGYVDERVADALGLPAGIPVVAAGSDGICAELGAGAVEPGQVYGYLGTATALASPILEPRVDPRGGVLISPGSVSGRWRALAIGFNGASAADWWRGVMGIDDPSQVDDVLDGTQAGARGIVFMPTLSGAGTPHWAPSARGAFLGLTPSHSARDLTRAVCEGVAVDLALMLAALASFGIAPAELRLTGGGARSDRWAQLIADVLQLRVERVAHSEPGLLGDACYALAARGDFADAVAAATALCAPAESFEPNAGLASMYAECIETYALARRAFVGGGLDERLESRGSRE